jgi:hypothetical protein
VGKHRLRKDLQIAVVVEPGRQGSANASASYSDIGTTGKPGMGTFASTNTINQHPLFADPAARVFLLCDGSPAIDGGDPSPVYNDGSRPPAKGDQRNDIGAYGGPNNGNWPR